MSYHPATEPNPTWSQATWFIDPANSSGVASDDNTGIDALHPVLSYNGGVVAKWGTTGPTLRQNTTITWMSSQPSGAADPVLVDAILIGVVLVLKANLPIATHTGALAGVVAKNRATGQVLTADLGFAATPGQLIRNTTGGKDSFAWVWTNVAGTTFKLSQPIAPTVVPMPESPPAVEVNSWANTDTFAVYDLLSINVTHLSANAAEFDAVDNFPAPAQVYHLNVASPDGIDSDNNFSVANASIIECSTNCIVDDAPDFASDFINAAQNCFLGSSVTSRNSQWTMFGGVVRHQFVGSVMPWSFGYDVIHDNTSGVGCVLGGPMGQGQAIPYLLDVYIDGVINFQNMLDAGQVPVPTIVWGPGTLNGIGQARLRFSSTNTAVGTFLNAGGLTLNSLASANAFNPATGVWSAPITITPAHLDATIAGGGFGGIAIVPGGASIAVGAL